MQLLSLQHEWIPKHLNFAELNPHIELDSNALDIPIEGRAWARGERPRRAGVSSFGFSGTNAHVILEEAPLSSSTEVTQLPEPPLSLLCFSAKTQASLEAYVSKLLGYLESSECRLCDISYTLNTGRAQLEVRSTVIVSSLAELKEKLIQREFIVHDASFDVANAGLSYPKPEAGYGDWHTALERIAQAYLNGELVDFLALEAPYKAQRKKIMLPTYAFESQSYWFQEGQEKVQLSDKPSSWEGVTHPFLSHRRTAPKRKGTS